MLTVAVPEACLTVTSRTHRPGDGSGISADNSSLFLSYCSRFNMWSPTRIAFAMAVNDGFTAPMLTKKLVSTR
jgi:hypothetical protein